MKKGILITLVILFVLIIVFFFYINYMRRKADKLEIKLGNIDWDKRNVQYTILRGGKFDESGTAFHRADLVGRADMPSSSSGKNEKFERMEKDAMVLYGTSAGVPQYRTTINFSTRTIS